MDPEEDLEALYFEIEPPVQREPTPPLVWPWSPRQSKRLTDKEMKEIRALNKFVRKNVMTVEEIAFGFGVSSTTIRRVLSKAKRKSNAQQHDRSAKRA